MSDTGVILALDLSTKTGFCCGRRFDRPPVLRCGTWVLPSTTGGSVGPTLSALDLRLARAIDEWAVDLVVFEAPLPAGSQTFDKTARMLISLPGIVEKVCHEMDVETLEANLASARKLILGRGRVPWNKELAQISKAKARKDSRERTKAMVMNWAAEQGITQVDDNAADAAVLHRYTATMLASRVTA